MKNIAVLLFGVGTLLFGDINAVVSVAPEKTFLEAIGGEKVHIGLMVPTGSSPHTYEPKPSQMMEIEKAELYFAIGVEFEEAWLPRFVEQNKKMKVVDVAQGVKKLPMMAHHDEEEQHGAKEHDTIEHEGESGLDPHIWTAPSNIKVIAKNMLDALVAADPANAGHYQANYDLFLKRLEQTDAAIKDILSQTKEGSRFMVFHPSWGYFAKEYGLVQLAIESGGKNPTPKQTMALIKKAKEERVNAILVAPEFSKKAAEEISKEAGIPVAEASPLDPEIFESLIRLAKIVAKR